MSLFLHGNRMVTTPVHQLNCPYYWFLKMTFHAVCNTALSEWKHPAEFEIWKCTVYKCIDSQKKESTLNHWNDKFLKRIPNRFMLTSTWNISILPAHLLVFRVGLNENADSFFATRCHFWSCKIAVSRERCTQSSTVLVAYQALQA